MENIKIDSDDFKSFLRDREAKRRADQLKSAVVALIFSFVGLAFSLSQLSNLFGSKEKGEDITLKELSNLRSRINELDARIVNANDLIQELKKPDPAASTSAEQQKLTAQMNVLDDRLKRIEAAILESPERALAIPLLRKDIDESAKRVEEYRASGRSDIDRLYELQKWMLGGIGTALLAVIGGALTIILRSLPKVKGDDT